MSFRFSDNWVVKSFEAEFGFSDVLANYSRLYAWMANQLGHMTIGLVTALVFAWVAESADVAARIFYAGFSAGAPAGLDWVTAWAVRIFAIVSLLAAAATANAVWFAKPALQPIGMRDHLSLSPAIRRGVGIAFTVFAGALLLSLGGDLLAQSPEDPGFAEAASRIGYLTATILVASIVIMLCEDAAFLALAAVSLIAAYFVATGGGGLASGALSSLYAILLALFAAIAIFSLVWPIIPAPKMDFVEKAWQLVVILLLCLWFHLGAAGGLSEAWRGAVGAGVAAVTLWWVKEFGSDLPKVYREAALVMARRPIAVTGAGERLRQDYLDDARIDSRTDGMFYFAGAFIGAGVLSEEPLFAEAGWESGVEILGVVIFIAIFFLFGRVWAHRQNALDQIGAARASRLAVFAGALKLGARPAAEARFAPLDDPISLLGDFSRGDGDRARHFDHLILFGRPGSGLGELGRAIASEAALSSHNPVYGEPVDTARPRTGRFIARNALVNQSAEILERRDLISTPTIPLWAPERDGDPVIDGRAQKPEGDYVWREQASVVVIGDLLETGPYSARDILANLSVAKGQQTVWLMHPSYDLDAAPGGLDAATVAEWSPDYEAVRIRVDQVAEALSEIAPKITLGVGFVARMAPARQPR